MSNSFFKQNYRMKKVFSIKWLFLLFFVATNAQQEKGIVGSTNWLNDWTEFKPGKLEYRETNQILFGNITTNTTLYKKNTYLLQGNVYIKNNAVLTIEPGTIIKGDFDTKGALVITKGATIIADGKETDPIIFTSSKSQKKAGDWGGVIVLGDAPINKFGGSGSLKQNLDVAQTIYGGTNVQSNSGIMRFVRIEYAGCKVKGADEFNALTLAGVGNKTILKNIMCSFSGDDSFEILGGDLSLSKLVSLKSNDDDFVFNQGTQCRIENSIAIRSSYVSSTSRSRCIEVMSYEKKEEADFSKKFTNVTATNLTLVNASPNLSADIANGLVKEAVFIANNALFSLKKTIISGFNPAVIFDKDIALNDINLRKIKLEELYFNNCTGNIFSEENANNEDLEDWYGNLSFSNLYAESKNEETFIDLNNLKIPDYRLKIAKIKATK